MASDETTPKKLGSLAQNARKDSLNQARLILILIGVLTIGLNAYMYFNAENEMRDVLEAERQKAGPGVVFDQGKVRQALDLVRTIYGGAFLLGVVFVVLGILVPMAPVPTTVLGLVLYIGATLAFAAIDPRSLAMGIIIKVIFIIGLIKAVQAAFAYQREVSAEAARAEPTGP